MKKKNKRLVILLIILVVVAIGAHLCLWKKGKWHAEKFNSVSTSQDSSQAGSKIPANWETYRDSELGVEFSYPKEWGEIFGYGIYTNRPEYLSDIEDPRYRQFKYGSFTIRPNETDPYRVLVSMGYNATPRDGTATADSGHIVDQVSVSNHCSESLAFENPENGTCTTFTNSNGLIIAQAYLTQTLGVEEPPGPPKIYYYIYTGHPVFPGLAFTLNNVQDAATMAKVIDTLKVVK